MTQRETLVHSPYGVTSDEKVQDGSLLVKWPVDPLFSIQLFWGALA